MGNVILGEGESVKYADFSMHMNYGVMCHLVRDNRFSMQIVVCIRSM